MRTACWIPKATNTHSEKVTPTPFPLLVRKSLYVTLYVHCLSCSNILIEPQVLHRQKYAILHRVSMGPGMPRYSASGTIVSAPLNIFPYSSQRYTALPMMDGHVCVLDRPGEAIHPSTRVDRSTDSHTPCFRQHKLRVYESQHQTPRWGLYILLTSFL